ncbi:unnamed protein product [Brachionus calyciflorus]|uniref:Uncharacterized protein n=1 Tax=Brachionus calyciflorus TaxID=104777 RepID=A0A813TG91_9BILA|nr:unnamed protein product [Brachionus calyciflorus]
MTKQEKETISTPLLEDFNTEIAVYVNAQEKIKVLQSFQDVEWIRVKLQPTIEVLITITNKLIWKFTSFLSDQIKTTLNELDQFLKRMEPDIEKITGEERDTATFMKIMRMFNEVSSKQQEMEVKFELMKRTLNLLKKYKRLEVVDLEAKFNSTPVRWTNLKSKVTLAKQRLGPTIQEESKVIIEDLKKFSTVINSLLQDIMNSYVFDRGCDCDRAFKLLDTFSEKYDSLQNQAEDLKQLQELLESDVVDFGILIQSKATLIILKQTWKTIKDIRTQHNEWKSIRWQKVNIKSAQEETDKQLELLDSLPVEAHIWDCYTGTVADINNIKNCLPIIEEIANPAMRTRHWKQLVRVSGGTNLVDNETLKMLTFGQLLDLNLHGHVDEVKFIVQKAVKDLSIEQTIKTYEEIWLSKIFNLKIYSYPRSETTDKALNEEDDKSSHDRRSSQSRIGMFPSVSTKSTKRLSIGSLPMSLIGVEPISDNDPVYLFENAEKLFAELEHHQIVLEELLQNQSAGSFYDEIIKWQNTLQNIEAILQEWNKVQLKWKRLEPIYSSYEIHTILPQDSTNFYKTDKDFRTLMKATHKNPNILKCCQRKNILNILKHLHQNLETCYESLISEMSKKRTKCPRLYILNDEDMLEILCCGSNLESLSENIGRVFNHVKSLEIDDKSGAEKKILGCYGRNNEYLHFKNPISFKGNIEDFINTFENAIPESLKDHLDLALNGNIPTVNSTTIKNEQKTPEYRAQTSEKRALPAINENIDQKNQSSHSVFSWLFQHTNQIIELSLKILMTSQIEKSLKEAKMDELKNLELKIADLIDFYNKQLNSYQFKSNASEPQEEKDIKMDHKSAIIISSEQREKLDLITKILIYYKNVIKEILNKNLNINSTEWLQIPKFYYIKDTETKVVIKILNYEINYGFQYYSSNIDEDCFLIYQSLEIQKIMTHLVNIILSNSSSLLHGKKNLNILKCVSQFLGYENHFFLCSENTTNDSINNICKAMVISGYWITFLNINNLSMKLMSSLSNVLTQINERKESVIINNDSYPSSPNFKNKIFTYFATIEPLNKSLNNSHIDSLRITKIDHYFSLLSKDLFEKFRIVKSDYENLQSFVDLNLISNGFKSNELLTNEILKIVRIYNSMFQCETKKSHPNFSLLDSFFLKFLIREASVLVHNKALINEVETDLNSTSTNKDEREAIVQVFSNYILPRIDKNSGKMLFNYLKSIWPDVEMAYKNEFLLENDATLMNLPIFFEKETAMQIEDKIKLNSIPDAVVLATNKLKLSSSVLFQTRAVFIIENLINYKNLLLVGKSGSGKTSLLKTAISALSELGYSFDFQHIFINSYTNIELFGHTATKSGSLKEGLIANTLRNFDKSSNYNLLHIVGESSSDNFYLFESLFENDHIFLNQNSEKTVNDLNKLKLVWESDDLSNMSPSVLATSNILYLNESLVTWEHIVESGFQSITTGSQSSLFKLKKELINDLKTIKTEIDLRPKVYTDVLTVNFESKVRLVLSIVKSMIKNNDRWDENDIKGISQYCVASGITAAFTQDAREAFDSWVKSILAMYPKEGPIYEYFYDIDSHQFQLWSENIPTFSCPVHQGIPLNIFVHTSSTMFLNSMLDIMMNLDESLMIVGEAGTGKTSLISDKLKTSCSGDLTELFYITINSNRLTNSSYLQRRINHHLSWVHGSYYVPKGNKRMYCFIDDIHQAEVNEYNRQTAVEFLRQHLDSQRIYDFSTKKWQKTKNITYISTFNTKVYSPSNSVSNKILKHFHVIAQHFPSNPQIHGIYTKLLYRHLIGDVENESSNAKVNAAILSRLKSLQLVLKNLIQSSIDLNQKMRSIYLEKSQRLHYVFTLRALTALFRHMCVSLTPESTKEQILLLWHHECDWLYGQRMIDNVDVERYQLAYKTVVKMNFSDQNELVLLNRPVYYSNLKETESGIVMSGLNNNNTNNSNYPNNVFVDGYEPADDLNQIRNLIQTSVNEYNKEHQRISIPLYESTVMLISRLCHTTQCVAGNCCIVADGGLSPFILQLVASLMQYSLVQFKASQFMYNKEAFFQQLKNRLISSYYKAGIRGEKVMLCLTEEEMEHKEFLAYITEFLISEEVMHLFTIEEETTILNSIRTQVVQSGLVYTRETAWEFFVKNIRENTRIVIVLNENAKKFQTLGLENPSLFNNMELIWIQHWSLKQLVDNALYHFKDIKWLDSSTKENLAHLLASMHTSIRENDTTGSAHLNNLSYTKLVEKFKELLVKKYKEIEFSHKNVCRLLENIQKQHSTAKKLLVQLQQENMVLEERINSTNKMLQQIGQDMTMTEQQLKVHNMQTKKTVQLKRILPEYQSAHERNVYKTVAIVANTKKLIQNINMNSLQELRSIQKPDSKMEDILAAVIMILKSPTADVTWQKGAKRQMANLDRFLEELQSFDEREITENTIKLLEDLIKKIDAYESKDDSNRGGQHVEALNTLNEWIKGVLRYHILMIKHVKPLHKKVEEIEKEVKEADQKLTTLNRKSEALNARLKDLAQNFEEATVDKEEQEEKVIKMKHQLQTASELNMILSKEFDRNMQIYESLQERIFCLPGACALAAGFLSYLGPYQFQFRRQMLTSIWVKCLSDRGLPLVIDSLNLIKGRVVKWQMDCLSHLLTFSADVSIPGEEWKVHFASDQITNEPFIVPSSEMNDKKDDKKTQEEEARAVLTDKDPSTKTVKIVDQEIPNVESEMVDSDNKIQNEGLNEDSVIKIENHAISAMSRLSQQIDMDESYVSASSYRQFIIALIQYVIGEDQCTKWMNEDASGLELENGTIIEFSEKHPPIIYDPFSIGTNWILKKTNLIIDLETRNSEDLLAIEKSFQSGTQILYSNCTEIDSILLPLIYYKNSMNHTVNADDSRLVFFSNRRLFCNPQFQMFFETSVPLETFSPNTLTCTTPISYSSSVENLIDQFQFSLFETLFPEEYKIRKILLDSINECNEKLKLVDELLKTQWKKDGFGDDKILLTKLALQRKYKIGEVLDYCQEYLASINELMKVLTPLAIRASLLMTLSLKMKYISKNYEFSINLVEYIIMNLTSLVKASKQELKLKTQLKTDELPSNEDVNESQIKAIESVLPPIPSVDEFNSKEVTMYTPEDMDLLVKYMTNSFLNSIILSLLPEHRLYLLTLISFYIKSEEKSEFTDLELEFLMRGKYNSNINISLYDFGVPKTTAVPNWIPKDNWNDLLAMSLLQGDLDHFVIAVVSAEKEWKAWYQNPLSEPFPKIEMEIENTSKTEMVELNDFRKLILHKVLRPDSYIIILSDYVNKSLDFKLQEPDWNFVSQNPLFKSIIVNMGSKSNISNTSSMSRIHKNLFKIAKEHNQKITALNCNFLTLSELRVVVKNVTEGFVLLKNVHLACRDTIDFIKSLCQSLNCESVKKPNWRLMLTKSFDYELPFVITSQSLQVSFDVIDILAHNSVSTNKKLTLDTCLIRSETVIFNSIQHSLNLTNNDEISAIIQTLPAEKKFLIYIICLTQGLLQSRQSLTCSGLQKFVPWGVSSLIQCFIAVKQYDLTDFTTLPIYLINNVYSNLIDDEMDKDYVFRLLKMLIESAKSGHVMINEIKIPLPENSILPNEYPNWIEEKIPERKIDSKVLQLHDELIKYYNTIRAEAFIENLEKLWETSSNNVPKLNDDLDQDWLFYSIKLCNDKLPPLLPKIDETKLSLDPGHSIAFAIYQEYKLFNRNMKIIQYHLKNIEKFLLLNTQLFPREWKSIALSLQSQRVPVQWENESSRPSVRTLKSWIKLQNLRYNELKEMAKEAFLNVKKVKASILKQPNTLFTAILTQKCFKEKLNMNEVEICFELKEDDKIDSKKDGILLQDLKIIGGKWDLSSKSVNKSENLVNKLPSLFIYADKKTSQSNGTDNFLKAYITNLRQSFVTTVSIQHKCSDIIPYLVFDCEDEEDQSRRLYRPVLSNVISNYQTESKNTYDHSPHLSAAGVSLRQNLSRSNQTLQQIREASAEIMRSPESQLSYKPMTPNAAPLPVELQMSFSRSKQI